MFVSLPRRLRLSIPTISASMNEPFRSLATWLPTNPQMPVTRMRMLSACRFSRPPAIHDLLNNLAKRDLDLPTGVVRLELRQIGDVADVIADPRRVDVFGLEAAPGQLLDQRRRPRRSSSCSRDLRRCCRPRPAAAPRRIGGSPAGRRGSECCRGPVCPCTRRPDRCSRSSATFTRYDRNPCSSTPLCCGPVKQPPRRTPDLEPEVASVLLRHDVGGHLRGAEQRVQAAIDSAESRRCRPGPPPGRTPSASPALRAEARWGRRRRPCSCS